MVNKDIYAEKHEVGANQACLQSVACRSAKGRSEAKEKSLCLSKSIEMLEYSLYLLFNKLYWKIV